MTFYYGFNCYDKYDSMKPLDIRIALLQKGYSNRRIAREMKLADSTVSAVINGHGTSRNVAKTVSDITGIPVSSLWPGRYPRLELAQIRAGRRAA